MIPVIVEISPVHRQNIAKSAYTTLSTRRHTQEPIVVVGGGALFKHQRQHPVQFSFVSVLRSGVECRP